MASNGRTKRLDFTLFLKMPRMPPDEFGQNASPQFGLPPLTYVSAQ